MEQTTHHSTPSPPSMLVSPIASLLETDTPSTSAHPRIHDCQPLYHTTSTAGGTLCLANNVSCPCSHTSASLSRQEILSNSVENNILEKNPSPLYPPSSRIGYGPGLSSPWVPTSLTRCSH